LELEMTVDRTEETVSSDKVFKLTVAIDWQTQRGKDAPWVQWSRSSQSVTRTVTCYQGRKTCSSPILVRDSHLVDATTYVAVSIPKGTDMSTLSWLDTVSFSYRFQPASFTELELGIRTFSLVVTLLVLFSYLAAMCGYMYCCWCTKNKGASTRRSCSGTSLWVLALLIALVFYNSPFYAVVVFDPSYSAGLWELFFQVTFISVLLVFFLIEFGRFATKDTTKLTCLQFYLPKIAIAVIYWALALGVSSLIILRNTEDPLYDWQEDPAVLSVTTVIGVVLVVVYAVYFAILMGSSLRLLCNRNKFNEFLLACFHLSVLAFTGFGIIAGSLYSATVEHTLELSFFVFLYNAYVWTLAYVYVPTGEKREDISVEALTEEDEAADAKRHKTPPPREVELVSASVAKPKFSGTTAVGSDSPAATMDQVLVEVKDPVAPVAPVAPVVPVVKPPVAIEDSKARAGSNPRSVTESKTTKSSKLSRRAADSEEEDESLDRDRRKGGKSSRRRHESSEEEEEEDRRKTSSKGGKSSRRRHESSEEEEEEDRRKTSSKGGKSSRRRHESSEEEDRRKTSPKGGKSSRRRHESSEEEPEDTRPKQSKSKGKTRRGDYEGFEEEPEEPARSSSRGGSTKAKTTKPKEEAPPAGHDDVHGGEIEDWGAEEEDHGRSVHGGKRGMYDDEY
jgi:hypothetical protein